MVSHINSDGESKELISLWLHCLLPLDRSEVGSSKAGERSRDVLPPWRTALNHQ
ncbi:hypothetical protein SynBIOSE41_00137 [Synechococcus sp. BIOS-E4-1]|nr:hypothetical protein SynBIOSE41_00137 [Synechococcus sp. BIOS-E4-1]